VIVLNTTNGTIIQLVHVNAPIISIVLLQNISTKIHAAANASPWHVFLTMLKIIILAFVFVNVLTLLALITRYWMSSHANVYAQRNRFVTTIVIGMKVLAAAKRGAILSVLRTKS
jgi:hypothetical protein